jgi:hypothetical protein
MTHGPTWYVRPPYPPFQGMVQGPPMRPPASYGRNGGPIGADSPTFGTHPYARGPRDFFMYYDKDEPSYAPWSYAR